MKTHSRHVFAKRNERMFAMFRDGKTPEQLAKTFNLKRETICELLRKGGFNVRANYPRPTYKCGHERDGERATCRVCSEARKAERKAYFAKRNKVICAMAAEGQPLDHIGQTFGLKYAAVRKIVWDDTPLERPLVSITDLLEAAGEVSAATYGEIIGTIRDGHVVRVRQIIGLLARWQGHSWPKIGRVLRRDHSTIVHGAAVVRDYFARSPDLVEQAARIFERACEIRRAA